MEEKKYVSPSRLSKFLDNLKLLFATRTEVEGKADFEHAHDNVVETNIQSEQKFWRGTKDEYNAIESKDETVLYIVTDEDPYEANGMGDMMSSIYDPQGIETDIFAYVDEHSTNVYDWAKAENKPSYTPYEIGAAPAGFGLGASSQLDFPRLTDPDNPQGTGWYYLSASVLGGDESKLPAPNFWGLVECRYGEQTAYWDGDNYGVQLHRHKGLDGTWEPWEYINPPMIADVEYRTIYRYQGKPVYVKTDSEGKQYSRTEDEATWHTYYSSDNKPSLDELGAASIDHTHTPASIGAAPAEHTHTPVSLGAASIENTMYRHSKLNGNYITSPDDLPLQIGLWLTSGRNSMTSKPDFHDTTGRATVARFFTEGTYGFELYSPWKSNRLGFRSDFTDPDSWNEIVTRKGGGALIQVGSYVGTGTYGADNPVQLTFNFPPKIITIAIDEVDADTTTYCRQVTLIYGQTFAHAGFIDVSQSGLSVNNMIVSGWGTNTIKFYAGKIDQNQAAGCHQMNIAGKKYIYACIC